ncbi:MAG: hypothetical protein P4M00_26000 [Azospirillaceae bacterium]|nr:hypothetical protein [Azospirillaceae bacterium]
MNREKSPRSDAGGLSYQQIALARLVADRHGITLPLGFEDDGPWTRRFLDVFAFDTQTEQDVFRRIVNLRQWAREGRDADEMGRKLDIKPALVVFALAVLRDSGFDLDDVAEDLGPDPEDAYWHMAEEDAFV